jgi:hypothetical protein
VLTAAAVASALALLVTLEPTGAVAATCAATRLDRGDVRAGPFVGGAVPAYDAVGGRFSLRVGGMRTETLSSKIPWFAMPRHKVGATLIVTGRRIGASPRTFRQTFARAYGGGSDPRGSIVFPSTIDPPTVGCWRLTLRSGNATGSLTMLARPALAP